MWEDHLHFNLLGEHVLIDGLHLDSAGTFFLASLLAASICLTERLLTYAISKSWNPFDRSNHRRQSRLGLALWRTALYWVVTLVRLLYMLIAMTFNFSLILVAITSLACGQFVIEYLDAAPSAQSDGENIKEPLLRSPDDRFLPLGQGESYPPIGLRR